MKEIKITNGIAEITGNDGDDFTFRISDINAVEKEFGSINRYCLNLVVGFYMKTIRFDFDGSKGSQDRALKNLEFIYNTLKDYMINGDKIVISADEYKTWLHGSWDTSDEEVE